MNRIAAATGTTRQDDGAAAVTPEPTPRTRPGRTPQTMPVPIQAQPGEVGPTRRRVVATTALGALAATALAACGGGADDAIPTTQPSAGETGSSSAGPSASETSGGGQSIAKVADIPVGGAISAQTADGTNVILAQPQAGKVVAFDARCPHQGCTVAPSGEKLQCPCHGSAFKTADGSLINGPATKGLTEFAVTVSGDDVVAG